jgi:heptose-I-phosphate ethanolaminephosphotransferase
MLGFIHGLPVGLALMALINQRRTFAFLVFPLVLCLPAILYYQHVYHMAPGVSLWLILINCSLSEIIEYLAEFALPLCLWVATIGPAYLVACLWLHGPIFNTPLVRRLCIAMLLVPAIAVVQWRIEGKPALESANQYFRDSFPWSALAGRLQALSVLKDFSDAEQEVANSSKVTMQRLSAIDGPRTMVLVVGESARRDRHSIYGYGQPTTPTAEQTEGLIAYSDVVTLHPQTVDAVPVILAKRNRSAPAAVSSPNLVSAFASAGFRTAWISNQAAIGQDDSPVSVYAKYADERWFARTLSRFGSIPYDDDLLPKFRAQLAATNRDKFIVLHLFGSHEEFARRYPAEFGVLPDAYDNSVRYTDAILSQILTDLEAMPGQSALVYVSDHGLKLGECNGRSEHYDLKESFEVPLYVWTSQAWQEAHPQLWHQAIANRSSPVTTMSVFDTFMDLADLRYPQYEPGLSLLSQQLVAPKRVVHTFSGPVDYDKGVNDKRCHLVAAGT